MLRRGGAEGIGGSADGDFRFAGSGGIDGGVAMTAGTAGEGGMNGGEDAKGGGGSKLGGPPSSGACCGARNGLPVATAAFVRVPFDEGRSSGSGGAPE